MTRSCHCHRQKSQQHPDLYSYFAAVLNNRRKSRRKRPCPAKGLCAPEFALGLALQTFKRALAEARVMLMADLEYLSATEKSEILLDFDRAVAHLVQQAEMKMGMWELLPLAICGLGGRNETQVRTLMLRLRTEYRKTRGAVSHHRVVIEILESQEIDCFIDNGVDIQRLPLLKRWRVKLRHVRVNELSVERLHAFGAQITSNAHNHSEAFLSHELRSPSMFEPIHGFDVEDVCAMVSSLKQVWNIVQTFDLERHPAILEEQRAHQERTGNMATHKISEKVVSSVVYRSDLMTLFQDVSELQKAITEYNNEEDSARKANAGDPLSHAAHVDATDEVKVNALLC